MMEIDGGLDGDLGEPRRGREDLGEASPDGKIAQQRREKNPLPKLPQRRGQRRVVVASSHGVQLVSRPCDRMFERSEDLRNKLGPRSAQPRTVAAELDRLVKVHREVWRASCAQGTRG